MIPRTKQINIEQNYSNKSYSYFHGWCFGTFALNFIQYIIEYPKRTIIHMLSLVQNISSVTQIIVGSVLPSTLIWLVLFVCSYSFCERCFVLTFVFRVGKIVWSKRSTATSVAFCFLLGKNATETMLMLKNACEDAYKNLRACAHWQTVTCQILWVILEQFLSFSKF